MAYEAVDVFGYIKCEVVDEEMLLDAQEAERAVKEELAQEADKTEPLSANQLLKEVRVTR